MLQKTEGIVIHTIPYSDTSLIAKIFTAEFGLLAFMLRGVRGKKSSSKAVMFQPLTILDLDIYYQESKNLHTIKETRLKLNPVDIYGNVYKTSIVLFLAEVMQKLLKDNYVNAGLFAVLKDGVEELNNKEFNPDFHLYMLLNISQELGFQPLDNYSEKEPVFSLQEGKFVTDSTEHFGMYYMNRLCSHHFYLLLSNQPVLMSRTDRRDILMEILKYFQLHLPGMSAIRSVAVLQEVL